MYSFVSRQVDLRSGLKEGHQSRIIKSEVVREIGLELPLRQARGDRHTVVLCSFCLLMRYLRLSRIEAAWKTSLDMNNFTVVFVISSRAYLEIDRWSVQ